jgi:hypothetical protein
MAHCNLQLQDLSKHVCMSNYIYYMQELCTTHCRSLVAGMIAGAKPQLDFYCFGRRAHNLGFGPMQIWVLGI